MARNYATSADYQAYTGQTPPAGIDATLAQASRMLDTRVFRLCLYEVDTDGYPSNSAVRQAFTDAVCAQARWWGEVGDTVGAAGTGWGSVGIGSVSLSRDAATVSGADSPARQIAPDVWDVLQDPDLTPDLLTLGVVVDA